MNQVIFDGGEGFKQGEVAVGSCRYVVLAGFTSGFEWGCIGTLKSGIFLDSHTCLKADGSLQTCAPVVSILGLSLYSQIYFGYLVGIILKCAVHEAPLRINQNVHLIKNSNA